MAVGFDSVSATTTAPTPSASAIPPSRQAPISPATARGKSNGERRQNEQGKGGAEFRATLDAVATATGQFVADAQARRAERKAEADKAARVEKRPAQGPAEVAASETAELYAATQSLQSRSAQTSDTTDEQSGNEPGYVPSSHEFLMAASRYAERFFSNAGTFAKPGESLELSA